MMELLQYEFVRNATITGILANITCCIIGVIDDSKDNFYRWQDMALVLFNVVSGHDFCYVCSAYTIFVGKRYWQPSIQHNCIIR